LSEDDAADTDENNEERLATMQNKVEAKIATHLFGDTIRCFGEKKKKALMSNLLVTVVELSSRDDPA